jgi:ubiquitin carboxyl-terminal hydrolase 7
MKVGQFAEQVAEERGLGEDQVRFWVMVNRQNKTTRPDQPLSDPNLTIEEAYNRYATKGNNCLRLWAEFSEQEKGSVEWPLARPQDSNNPILIFLKYFDLEEQTLTGVGHTYVKKHQKVGELASHILEIMDWPAGTQFMLYEASTDIPITASSLTSEQEIKFSMIEPMKPKQTFQQSEIQDGDVICFQRQSLEKR